MRTKAAELKEAAERATDPDARMLLQARARRLEEESKQADDKGGLGRDPL
jgi:hypothetical protein